MLDRREMAFPDFRSGPACRTAYIEGTALAFSYMGSSTFTVGVRACSLFRVDPAADMLGICRACEAWYFR